MLLLGLGYCCPAFAQYPRISSEIATESNHRMKAADARSDEAWARAQAAIREWAARGKPYIPDADEPDDLPQAAIPAFPGAQGGGMYSHGGRGGKVFVVTNLNDAGPGSFREACEAGGPRFVVFNIAGIIKLTDRIRIRAPCITISGATAPGDGVCIAGNTVEIETHDVIIRHLRFRRGTRWVGDRNDSLGGNAIGNIIIDHVSASWGLDENMSLYRHMYQPPDGGKELKLPTVNITIQNSIFSEALNTYHHAFGSTIGGYNATFHHNLWACNTGRNPSVGMIYDFTFANNVLFNWRHRTVDGGDHRSFYTVLNNYFKPGPVTPRDAEIRFRLLKPESRRAKPPVDDYGLAYVKGNIVEGNDRVTADNWDGGVQPEPLGDRAAVVAGVKAAHPYPHAYLALQPASDAYEYVLANAGATLPRRDAVDRRIIDMVRTGTVTAKAAPDTAASLGGVGFSDELINELVHEVSLGIITDPDQVGGYPDYRGTPYPDADQDGMPDDWETRHGLNPNDPTDTAGDQNHDSYTHIEEFLCGLDPTAHRQEWPAPQTYVDLWKINADLRERLAR
ncbi:MAG: polysaccharide lyase [Verrucomicrobiales bacterium]|nr:polysaccharide lyase [Verrucomicrobiales bacterium]